MSNETGYLAEVVSNQRVEGVSLVRHKAKMRYVRNDKKTELLIRT